ncbi:MAG: hypothetical protein LBL41_05095 [Bifidobacteriaceae bacterium]|nr:hypothetical protein [Bifidobacteriaceae bacterium]
MKLKCWIEIGKQIDNIENSLDWKLSGTLTKEGYFSGIYSAISPWDHGNGYFFLTIGGDKVMRGMWSGYDRKNDQVSSGKYKFVPKAQDLEISRRLLGNRLRNPILVQF